MSQPEREIDARLADWVDGHLTDRERERFLAELRVNAQLRADLAEYERTVAAVRQALRAPTRPADLGDRVLSAIAVQKATVAARRGTLRRRPLYWSLAAAAALLVLAIALNAWPSAGMPERSPDTVASIDSLASAQPDGEAPGRETKQLAEQEAADAPRAALSLDAGAAADDVAARLLAKPEASRAEGAPAPGAKPDPSQSELVVSEKLVTGVAIAESKPGEAGKAAKEQAAPAPLREAAPAENRRETGEPYLGATRDLSRQAGNEPPSRERQAQGELERLEQRTATPLADERDRAAGAWTDLAATQRGYAAPQLPMVSLTRYRTVAPAATAGGGAAAGAAPMPFAAHAMSADAAGVDLDAFFASQVGLSSTFEKKIGAAKETTRAAEEGVSRGNLRFVPLLAPPAEADRDKDSFAPADRKRSGGEVAGPTTGGAAVAENHWLVEGSKQDVAEVVRRVAEYGKRAGFELTNGEIASSAPALQAAQVQVRVQDGRVLPRGDAKSPPPAVEPAPAAPTGQVAPSTPPPPGGPVANAPPEAADRVQVVLRFRVLPSK